MTPRQRSRLGDENVPVQSSQACTSLAAARGNPWVPRAKQKRSLVRAACQKHPPQAASMEGGALGLAKFLVPKIPSLANTAIWHTVGMTETSDKWDLRTTLTVSVLRSMMGGGGRGTVSQVQGTTLKDPGVKGKTWIATAKVPAPKEETLREAVFGAIEDMKTSDVDYTRPELVDIEVEWTGFRPKAGENEALPKISEEEKYKKMMAEPTRTSETTILYFHGGAYYLCDPITHRALCSRLAKESHGRVCSVRYRLAPQAAFPSQLLDAFMMYLSLLYPPPGSMHEAVPAKNVVIGGDSAGGNLAFALLQLLLQLNRSSSTPTVNFHGKEVAVPLPAGCTANSGWFDITRALPSITGNAKYDYLPPPNHDDAISRLPKDDIWPTNPPRGDMFCDLSLLDHPLVSMVGAESWANSPPLWFDTGEEMLSDEDKAVVTRAVSQGVTVQFEEYEAMPHCFSMLLPTLKTADMCMRSWGDFCRRCAEEPESLKTNAKFVYAKSAKEEVRDIALANKISIEEVRSLLADAKQRRIKGYKQEGKAFPPQPAL